MSMMSMSQKKMYFFSNLSAKCFVTGTSNAMLNRGGKYEQLCLVQGLVETFLLSPNSLNF